FQLPGGRLRDYQLPLYCLALNQDPFYQGRIQALSLQIIRPRFPDNPDQGAICLKLPVADVIEQSERMLSELSRYVVKPILTSPHFEINPGRHCQYCSYQRICETRGEEEDMAAAEAIGGPAD